MGRDKKLAVSIGAVLLIVSAVLITQMKDPS